MKWKDTYKSIVFGCKPYGIYGYSILDYRIIQFRRYTFKVYGNIDAQLTMEEKDAE